MSSDKLEVMSGQPNQSQQDSHPAGADSSAADPSARPHRRRPRYSGTHPRKYSEKYKEHRPELYPETFRKVIESGKTPAGSHRPIMVQEVIQALQPAPGCTGVDCTLGHGGHAQEFLNRMRPGGKLLALDADPIELPRTEARLRELGSGPEELLVMRTNFAGLPAALARAGLTAVDFVFADLGVSSMQLDDPGRGFSYKTEGPLDMRMNPHRPKTAAAVLKECNALRLAAILQANADEPYAARIAVELAGTELSTTSQLAASVDRALKGVDREERESAKRRVFQALRIEVNGEFEALETLLRCTPGVLAPGGRAALLTFHSGEDRRVKQAFSDGLRSGIYSEVSGEVIRPSPEEIRSNPRSKPAKLRWALRSPGVRPG